MLKRLAAALLLCLGLAACDQNGIPKTGSQTFIGQGNVRVVEAHWMPTGESSATTAGGSAGYVLAQLEFTNDTGADMTPDVSHFYLMDALGTRYQGHDSGSAVFTGVSNSTQVLKKDEKRLYTVGFRANDPNTTGAIFYDRSY